MIASLSLSSIGRISTTLASVSSSLKFSGCSRLASRSERPALTPREIDVLELVAEGLRNKEIASSLGLSETTVQVHVKNILSKLRVNDRTAAVNVALRRGIIHIN